MTQSNQVHRELRRLGRKMNRRLESHPDQGLLRLYALDELAEGDRIRTMLHLDHCSDCRSRLARMEVTPDWSQGLADLRRRLPRTPGVTQELLGRLRGYLADLADLWPQPGFHPIPVAATRSGSVHRGEFQAAMVPYRTGQLAEAVVNLEQYLERNPDDHEALFYLGATHLKQQEPALALELLEQAGQLAGEHPPPRYRWSLIEALLGCGRLDQARIGLDRLVLEGGTWGQRAETALQSLPLAA